MSKKDTTKLTGREKRKEDGEKYTHPGQPPIYTPDELREKFDEYVQWAEDNPLYSTELFHYQGEIIEHKKPLRRILNIQAFCIYAKMTTITFYEYAKKSEYSNTCTYIDNYIYLENIEGGSAGTYDKMIVARKLGLRDKIENEVKGEMNMIWQETKTYDSNKEADGGS